LEGDFGGPVEDLPGAHDVGAAVSGIVVARGSKVILLLDSGRSSRMHLASSMMVVSWGLPMLMGSEKSASMAAEIPRTVSETKQKERVWVPSPAMVMGSFFRACRQKLVTTRPSAGCMRG